MKKILIILVCVLLVFCAFFKFVNNTLVFETADYKVFMPSGAPVSEWEKIDEYYSTAYCSFSVANIVLLNDDLDSFEDMFYNCYKKFSSNDDVYAVMSTVFLSENIKYSHLQIELLLSLLEQFYNEELKKTEPNSFLLEKNLMLRIEINYKNGKLFDALALKTQL